MACESCARRRAKLLRLVKLAAERAKALFEKADGNADKSNMRNR